jgi:hypothetical protein
MNLNKNIKALPKSNDFKTVTAKKVWANISSEIGGFRNYWISNKEHLVNLFEEILPLVVSIPGKPSVNQLVRNLSNLYDLSIFKPRHKRLLDHLINKENIRLTASSILKSLGE